MPVRRPRSRRQDRRHADRCARPTASRDVRQRNVYLFARGRALPCRSARRCAATEAPRSGGARASADDGKRLARPAAQRDPCALHRRRAPCASNTSICATAESLARRWRQRRLLRRSAVVAVAARVGNTRLSSTAPRARTAEKILECPAREARPCQAPAQRARHRCRAARARRSWHALPRVLGGHAPSTASSPIEFRPRVLGAFRLPARLGHRVGARWLSVPRRCASRTTSSARSLVGVVRCHAQFQRVPLFGGTYGLMKQVFESVFSSGAEAFQQAVLVEYPRSGIWVIAFVTAKGVAPGLAPSPTVSTSGQRLRADHAEPDVGLLLHRRSRSSCAGSTCPSRSRPSSCSSRWASPKSPRCSPRRQSSRERRSASSFRPSQAETTMPMFNFILPPVEDMQPWGAPDELHLSWFASAKGWYFMELGARCAVPQQRRHGERHSHADYPVVRLWHDVLDIVAFVIAEVPADTVHLRDPVFGRERTQDAFRRRDRRGPSRRGLAWWYRRELSSGHLIAAPTACSGASETSSMCRASLDEEDASIWQLVSGFMTILVEAFVIIDVAYVRPRSCAMGQRVERSSNAAVCMECRSIRRS